MRKVAYIDESDRRPVYVLAAMTVEHQSVAQVRKMLRSAALGGGVARRHFTRERPNDKKKVLSIYRALPGVAATVVVVDDGDPPVRQRATALDELTKGLVADGVDRIVLDHVEPVDAHCDRQVLLRATRGVDVDYSHEVAHTTEPMLWVPDAVAWCAGLSEWAACLDGWVTILRR